MLFLLQIALGLTVIGLLILAVFDAIRGFAIILSGLVLIVVGYTLKGVSIVVRKIHPAPAVTPVVRAWKIIGTCE